MLGLSSLLLMPSLVSKVLEKTLSQPATLNTTTAEEGVCLSVGQEMAVSGASSFWRCDAVSCQPHKSVFCLWFLWSPDEQGILTTSSGLRQNIPPPPQATNTGSLGLRVPGNSPNLRLPPAIAHRAPAPVPAGSLAPLPTFPYSPSVSPHCSRS